VRSVWIGVSFVCAQVECAGSVKSVCFFKSQKFYMGLSHISVWVSLEY
jgi:hypothetical protein